MSAQTIAAPVAAPTVELTGRITFAQTVSHSLALAGRGFMKFMKSPIQLVDVILTPIISLLMFVYLFGEAMGGGNTDAYIELVVPGVMVMAVFQASVGIGASLAADASTGIFDRFRSMPIARSAPLIGAVLADIVRYVACLVTLVVLALVMGYRFGTNPVAWLGASALLIGFALAFSWMSVYLGMLIKNPTSVQGLMTILILPLTFASNVFMKETEMAGWLQAWSDVNPVSLVAEAVRGLLNGGPVAHGLYGSLIWMAAVVAVFFPLAMRAYRKSGPRPAVQVPSARSSSHRSASWREYAAPLS
ncbi:ABC transporter permease [Streptomyces sp. YC504]|uniref:Transport permease protein n=1 Tax=Streptomyces mesophilus TaxID=1775132 RepID=A0A6G4XK66_9ACTN|nr:ABC transporter permease [Streptomyces mesophilus]NGO77021.1 ABC transporter permease [Streptomyces mesophilus]